jgi:hypothetical protein
MNSDCVLVDLQVLVSCGGCFETIGIKRVVGVFYCVVVHNFSMKRMWLGNSRACLASGSLFWVFFPVRKWVLSASYLWVFVDTLPVC